MKRCLEIGTVVNMKKETFVNCFGETMDKEVAEIGPRPFGRPDIKPDIEVGDQVFVCWANDKTYTGIIRDKLTKNWSVEIQDDTWHHKSKHASVPGYALIRRHF